MTVFPGNTEEFSIDADLIADMEMINPFDFFLGPYAENWPFQFQLELQEDVSAM